MVNPVKFLAAAFATTLLTLPLEAQSEGGPAVPDSVKWKARVYNPAPLPDDAVMPLACGGAMVFRRVHTPNADGVVGDVPVILGQQGSDQPFLDGLRRAYVSGAFPSDTGETRGYFYLAKYELTQAQYDAVMAESDKKCPKKVGRKGRLPAVNLSKTAFEKFAERYTIWLMQNAPEFIPTVGKATGFVRLPTEEEWEFAARGGLKVAEAEFRMARPPIGDNESYSEYIAHAGSDSAGGELQSIGTLKPNPLGLHDMLGNAWELIGSPFALVRHGRLHGQAGGLVRRGGGANWPLGEITSAQRFEMAPYNGRKLDVQTERFTGARFAISAISITSEEQNALLIEELNKMATPDQNAAGAQSEIEVHKLLEQMKKDALTPQEQAQVQVIADTLRAATADRNTQRDKALRMILTSSVLLCNQAVQRYLTASFASKTVIEDLANLEDEARATGDLDFLNEVLAAKEEAYMALDRLGAHLKQDVTEYANLIEGIATDHGASIIRKQADFIRAEQTGITPRRDACYGILRTHLETRFSVGASDIQDMRDDFESIAVSIQDRN